jgi:CheY-specific phosphatase CheX
VTQAHLNGTVQEAINMIAGNTFSTLDDTEVFELGIPELADMNAMTGARPGQLPEEHFLLVETFAGNLALRVCFKIE